MGKALVLAVVLVLLAAPAAKGAAGTQKLMAGAEETVLRLHDLPPGYEVGSDSDCEPLESSGVAGLHALDSWIVQSRPAACSFEYDRRFRVPGSPPAPFRLDVDVIGTRSVDDAAKGVRIFRRLISRLTAFQAQGAISVVPGGPVATLYRRSSSPTSFDSLLLWRHDKLFAAIEATASTAQGSDEAALYYAQIQQHRLESPSPYTEAERDDTEVELDDPSLKIPVYWLGSNFTSGGLGSAELQTASVVGRYGPPGVNGVKLELRYDGFNLQTWTRPSWKRFQSSSFRKINHPPCTRTFAFEWEQGHATISAGYRRRTFDKGCPDFPPTRYWAAAHVGGVVVGVNQTTCRCLSPGSGPYSESLRGMKTILRGLALRPKPVY